MLTPRATIEQTIACNRNQTKMGNLSGRISGDPKRCWLDQIGMGGGRVLRFGKATEWLLGSIWAGSLQQDGVSSEL